MLPPLDPPGERSGSSGWRVTPCCADAVKWPRAASSWRTASDNEAAQRLYDTTVAERSTWVTYDLML